MKRECTLQLITIMICLTISLWGCGGYTITISFGAPAVVSTTPADGATQVKVNLAIRVVFSEEMDASTITPSTFIVKTPNSFIAGTILSTISSDEEFLGSTVVTFTPLGSLQFFTLYTVVITNGIKNLSGVPLEADHSWTFTTEPAPNAT
jgi:hypothetical protein